MDSTQSLSDFYREKLDFVPVVLRENMGHFNVFRMEDFVGKHAKPIPYSRKDYFKISLLVGKKRLLYANKEIEVERQALLFANPLIPYKWEPLEEDHSGYFCIFTASFFDHFGKIADYPVFQPGVVPVYPLDDSQRRRLEEIYLKMLDEIDSDYSYKYDVLRNLTFELIHAGLKMRPAEVSLFANTDASTRIASIFLELLERQFPIESPGRQMPLQTPSAFAEQMAVHVNHLNKALKKICGKTTSQLIAERVAREAAFLLKNTNWPIGDIAWSLGFNERPPFIHFFKKHFTISPRAFRNRV
jgi:AraC-like DNA-binding protein